MGELVTVTDAAGNKTVVGYDLLGRRTSLDNPDAGLVAFHYDPAGNLVAKIDANLCPGPSLLYTRNGGNAGSLSSLAVR